MKTTILVIEAATVLHLVSESFPMTILPNLHGAQKEDAKDSQFATESHLKSEDLAKRQIIQRSSLA